MAGRQPNPLQPSLDQVRGAINPINEQLGGLAQMLIDRGTGAQMDPLIEAQRRQGLIGQSGQLSRAGITGGTADNALGRLNSQYDLAQLGARNEALSSGTNILQTTGQNELALGGLDVGALAAQNAGQGGGKPK